MMFYIYLENIMTLLTTDNYVPYVFRKRVTVMPVITMLCELLIIKENSVLYFLH